jgi:hypothetical protein
MTECDEIAESIWRARSSASGNGLNATQPIHSYTDAKRVARHYCHGQGEQIITNVAISLWQIAQRTP